MKFVGSQDLEVSKLAVQLKKEASPIEKVSVRIETEKNGKPSGELVHEKAKALSDVSLLSTNYEWCSFTFDEVFILKKSTTYYIVIEKENGEVSSTSYYNLQAYE